MTTMLIKPRSPKPADGPVRQNQIAFLLRWSLTNKEIAIVLGISEATIKVHLKTLCHKLGMTNRTQIAITACKHWGFPDDHHRAPKDETELDALLYEEREESPTPPEEVRSTHFWNLGDSSYSD